MNAEQIKQNVSVIDVLDQYMGIQLPMRGSKSRNIPCPIHRGQDDNFAVDLEKNIATCFSQCGKSWNVIDLTMEIHHTDFKGAVSLLERDFHLSEGNPSSRPGSKPGRNKTADEGTSTAKKNYTNLYNSLAQDPYFLNRGLSQEIIEKYKLGAVGEGTDLRIFENREKAALNFWRFIIPISEQFFIARLDEAKADGAKYRNFGNAELLNKQYIGDTSQTFIFVTEGAIDTFTIETFGYPSIALNSAANASLLVNEIQSNEEKARQQQFILLADNDKAGTELEEKLHKYFKNMNMTIYIHKWYKAFPDVKDINELAINNPDQAAELIKTALDECVNGHSAFYSLVEFFTDMKPVQPIQITAFPKLNEVIGGLRTGLYVVGAASSIGKTTYVQELSDDVASQGEHVLFFSLEMSKKELIAKSLVRTMGEVKRLLKKTGEITYTRDLLSGNIKDHELLTAAAGLYEKTAQNLFIYEGMFDMNVYTIRQEVEKHMRLHRKKPLVVVDYLQILQPLSDRMSEKQATDKNVTELKRITRDLDIPLIVISSFNRDSYNREASFSAFKESGAIEYGSDVVIAMELQKVKNAEKDSNGKVKDQAELDQAKSSLVRDINLKILKNRFGKAFEEIGYSYMTSMNKFKETDGRDFTEEVKSKRI